MEKITNLRDATRELLTHRPRTLTLAVIATDTGLSVGWLQAFARGIMENPGVVSVETLYVYLSNKKQEREAK